MRIGVIMAGGIGERFWPCSRKIKPKQLLRIVSDKSFLQEAVERISSLILPENIFIVTSRQLKEPLLREIPDFPQENIICEPVGRNTAACLALAEVITSARFSDPTMAVLTADHLIRDTRSYLNNVEVACRIAEKEGSLVTIGITPTRPETGFGYIEAGEILRDEPMGLVFRVKRFLEKPDAKTADWFLKSGQFFWNSGMFFWKNSVLRDNMERFIPETMAAMDIFRRALGTPDEEAVLERIFAGLDNISIDCAIMEKAENVCMVRADFDWDDLGTWNSLERFFKPDKEGNLALGRGILVETENTTVYNPTGANGPLVAAFGLHDMLIVVDGDVVMVCPKSRAPDLKNFINELKNRKMDEYL